MADLNLDILITPTYNKLTMGIVDISTYPDSPPIDSPSLEVEVPGFDPVNITFVPNDFNVLNSENLGITDTGEDLSPIPDGPYTLTYSVTPAYQNFVTKTFYRTEKFQEKFDEAFMKMDMMECDLAIKKQQSVELNTIWFLIQGAIAAANNCAVERANKLYNQANNLLDKFINNACNCSGVNFITNFNTY